MVKDIVSCGECEFFTRNNEGMGMCKHPNGLPFPVPNDYCSKGGLAEKTKILVNNEELLKRVYEQRKS